MLRLAFFLYRPHIVKVLILVLSWTKKKKKKQQQLDQTNKHDLGIGSLLEGLMQMSNVPLTCICKEAVIHH